VFDLLTVIVDQVGRLLGVSHRLEPALANLETHDRREPVLALAYQLRGTPQDRDAIAPWQLRPARLRPVCLTHRPIDMRRRPGRESPEDDARVDGRGVDDRVARSGQCHPRDIQGVCVTGSRLGARYD